MPIAVFGRHDIAAGRVDIERRVQRDAAFDERIDIVVPFVASRFDGFTSPATVLPMQIFLWSDEIDRGFVERTSAAIIVLLLFLLVMNGLAIYLRNKFEKTW